MTKKSKKSKRSTTNGELFIANSLAFGDRLKFVDNARTQLINNPDSFPDVELVPITTDKSDNRSILTHRAILSAKSPVLKQFFKDILKSPTKNNAIVRVPLSFDYETVMAFVEFSYANAARLKLKNLVNLISFSVCYGCTDLMELCKSYCRYKTQKVVENSQDDDDTSLTSYRPKPNPLIIIDCVIATYDEKFMREILLELLPKIRICHLTENAMVQTSFGTMRVLLSSDELLIDEIELIEFYTKWAFLHGQSFNDDKIGRKIEKCIDGQIIFNHQVELGRMSPIAPQLNSLPNSSESLGSEILNETNEDISNLLRYYLLDDQELDILKATNAIPEKALTLTRYVKKHVGDFQGFGLKRRQGTKQRSHFDELGIQ